MVAFPKQITKYITPFVQTQKVTQKAWDRFKELQQVFLEAWIFQIWINSSGFYMTDSKGI